MSGMHRLPAARDDEARFMEAQAKRLDEGAARAGALVAGSTQAAQIAEAFARGTFAETPTGEVSLAIDAVAAEVSAGSMTGLERMLVGEAVALHSAFAALMGKALPHLSANPRAAETLMRLALRAQAQATRTAEVLGNLRAGPTIFARQANVAQQMQVVNGQPIAHPRAQETSIPANEVLRGEHHEQITLDPGTPSQGRRCDPAMAPVGTQYRPED